MTRFPTSIPSSCGTARSLGFSLLWRFAIIWTVLESTLPPTAEYIGEFLLEIKWQEADLDRGLELMLS